MRFNSVSIISLGSDFLDWVRRVEDFVFVEVDLDVVKDYDNQMVTENAVF